MQRALAFALLATAACGGDDTGGATDAPPSDGSAGDGAAIDAATDGQATDAAVDAVGPLALTSTAFAEGAVIPRAHACHGANVSPALAWSGGPAAAGYAVIFTDITPPQLIHSIIWDIPGTVRALPEDVDKVFEPLDVPGAKQPLAYDGATRGYLGPCPGSMHTYEFRLYPIDVNPLPGVTQSSSRNAVRNALLLHVVGGASSAATLTGTYTPP